MNIKHSLLFTLLILSAAAPAHGAPTGTWACKVDSKEWEAKGGASINAGKITLYSSDDRIDGIFIMTNKPAAVDSYALNDGAQASFSDAAGANQKSKTGSGTLVISKYAPPQGDVLGKVEGTFSGDFDGGAKKGYVLKDCTFSLPVKNL